MGSRLLFAIGVGAASLAVVAAIAPSATARSTAGPLAFRHSTSPAITQVDKGKYCYQQLANDFDSFVVSQNFEKSFDADDSQGADDFTLNKLCSITKVQTLGSGNDLTQGVNVTFYQDHNGAPGSVISTQKKIKKFTVTDPGNLMITLPTTVALRPGHYWVSVQVNNNVEQHGEWLWGTNSVAIGDPSVWRNPDNGFGLGCTRYTTTTTCVSIAGPDFAFGLMK